MPQASNLFKILDEIGISSYTDDNLPYISEETSTDVINFLEQYSIKLFKWFSVDQMKAVLDIFMSTRATA